MQHTLADVPAFVDTATINYLLRAALLGAVRARISEVRVAPPRGRDLWRAPMDELDTWLETSIGAEPLRAEVRQACGGSLEHLRSCELEDLESELSLSAWPPLERQRFLSAWRGL